MFDKKILCLGDNSESTDQWVTDLAGRWNTTNFGLITTDSFVPAQNGLYHTSLADLSAGSIIQLVPKFDQVIMLDQPREQWSHWKLLLSTYRIMRELESLGHSVLYQNNKNIEAYQTFDTFLKTNKSFCIYPWIEKIEHDGQLNLCSRSTATITTLDQLVSWKHDPKFGEIRQKMLAGERLPRHCHACYNYEERGIESYRQFETREWISKLNINSLEDLERIEHPYYYEIRLNNKCNLACRGCRPSYSSRIEEEYKKHNIVYMQENNLGYSSLDIIDQETLSPDVRVYLTGGEPTVMVPVYEFMEQCVERGRTDFDFTIGTNAAVLSKRFLNLSQHFTNLNFSVSLDGYGKINDYWRWGSQWDQVIANTRILQEQGHTISINCVPGIYNVTNLHLLLEFLDQEFPMAGIYLQINYNSWQSAYNHPNADLVLASMERCMKTKFYYTDGKSMKTTVDSIWAHYSKNPGFDAQALREFFAYNDRLDQIRNVKLADYIPELEDCRKYIG